MLEERLNVAKVYRQAAIKLYRKWVGMDLGRRACSLDLTMGNVQLLVSWFRP